MVTGGSFPAASCLEPEDGGGDRSEAIGGRFSEEALGDFDIGFGGTEIKLLAVVFAQRFGSDAHDLSDLGFRNAAGTHGFDLITLLRRGLGDLINHYGFNLNNG